MRTLRWALALAGVAVALAALTMLFVSSAVKNAKSTPVPSHFANSPSTQRPRSPGILWDSAEPVSGD
jgi:hypothetical protein